jgi:hypothetical protein
LETFELVGGNTIQIHGSGQMKIGIQKDANQTIRLVAGYDPGINL